MTGRTLMRWDFHRHGDAEGWEVPDPLRGGVRGGCLWIQPAGEPMTDRARFVPLSGHNYEPFRVASPPALELPADGARKLRLRLLNASPETDIAIEWTTQEAPDAQPFKTVTGIAPYYRDWQEVILHLDAVAWEGTLDQMWLSFPKGIGGNVYIDGIAVTGGALRTRAPRPDIRGEGGIPIVEVPGLTQDHVIDAFDILADAVVYEGLPVHGFPTPFLAPGAEGAFYGKNWWLLDASLAMMPVLWTDLDFCAAMIQGFITVQTENPDGNISFEGKFAGRGAPWDLSVIPRYFEAAHALVRMRADRRLNEAVYDSMRRYLDWWCSPVKRDAATGLVTAYFEESFTDAYQFGPGELAAVDTNVAVALGAWRTAEVAERMGKTKAAEAHRAVYETFKAAINHHLWNKETRCYQSWIVPEGRFHRTLANHTFDPLRTRIAPPDRVSILLERLRDPTQFGWGGIGLTTIAQGDPAFKVATGAYDGLAWDGGVWTMRNLPVIAGLRDIGRDELAADLTWQTLRLFAGTYAEWLEPATGTGQGVARYAWTAAQWLQTVIEHLFGLTYDAHTRTLYCAPLVAAPLWGKTLTLRNLRLPDAPDRPIAVIVRTDPAGTLSVTVEGIKRTRTEEPHVAFGPTVSKGIATHRKSPD